MKRNKHSLSYYNLATFDMGQLVPVGVLEVLPGDSVRMSTSCLLRVSPLMTPVMHPVSVRIHHWFVPYRLVWENFEDFITGGSDGEGDGAGTIPTYGTDLATAGSLGDYFGIPLGPAGVGMSRLPFRAYNLIWNHNYRDQDLVPELGLDESVQVQQICWEKDAFTAARPWPQKGPDVTLPLGGTAPVVPTGSGIPSFDVAQLVNSPLASLNLSNNPIWGNGTPNATDNAEWNNPALEADLTSATAVGVNDVRLAFALQRYQEARAQYGSRYTEYLRYLGVRSSDARLQLPEYLGGGKSTLSFSEVLKTGEGDTPSDETPIGEMRGHGVGALRSRRFVRFFEEHGVVLTLASVRPRAMYASGMDKMWSRTVKEDFWQKELELIGQEEVANKEIYLNSASPNAVFGYQDRYYDYRHQKSHVCGEFRSTLNDWHLARIFGSEPVLNADFVKCVPSKRIHADQTSNVLWGMFSHSIQARRMVGHKTIGRIF